MEIQVLGSLKCLGEKIEIKVSQILKENTRAITNNVKLFAV